MSYAVRFRKRAKEELDKCCDIYQDELPEYLYEWLSQLAISAEKKDYSNSVDMLLMLEMVESGYAWKKFCREPLLTKLKAFITFLKRAHISVRGCYLRSRIQRPIARFNRLK